MHAVIDNRDSNNVLYNCGNGVGRRNAVFGELYHVSGVSNRLDQRQTGARGSVPQLLDVVQEPGLRN